MTGTHVTLTTDAAAETAELIARLRAENDELRGMLEDAILAISVLRKGLAVDVDDA